MGKSHFSTHYLEKSLKVANDQGRFTFISQDDIRTKCLAKWQRENRSGSIEEGLKAIAKEAAAQWPVELQEKIMRASKDKNAHYIFLDKNFPPAEQVQTLSAIKAFEENGYKINKIAVVPKIKKRFQDYPFSLAFFLQCYLRCLNRKGHLTISSNDPERIVKILVLFFKQFKDVHFDDSLLQKGFDQIMPVNFTIEDELFQLPANIDKLASQIIDKGLPDSETLISNFCKTVDVYRQIFGVVEPTSKEGGSEIA